MEKPHPPRFYTSGLTSPRITKHCIRGRAGLYSGACEARWKSCPSHREGNMQTQRPSGGRGCSKALVFCIFLITSQCVSIPAHSQTDTISTRAYQEINQRIGANQESFYVYLDQDSGFNHGFPSGFMGTDQRTIGINTGCI